MPVKLLNYLLRHCVTGLTLSSVTVLGFSYFLLLPGTRGTFIEKIIDATGQLMLISHLIMPLVILIGLAYGLGLLHNNSEMVQILQQSKSYALLAIFVATFCILTTVLETFYWPTLEPTEPMLSSQWQQKGNLYYNDTTAVKTDNGHISSASYKNSNFGSPLDFKHSAAASDQSIARRSISTLYQNRKAKSINYEFWKQIYQAAWAIPLFFFLWYKLKQCSRGSTAANTAGSVAITAIALGLFCEATHIVLTKALVQPYLTMLVPFIIAIIGTGYRVVKT
ncbi:MAG: hypothetical protein P8X89_17950 [Reinekea sp.]